MNNPKPLISILLPVHNAEKYLSDCLNSLINQTYKNIEIVAIDDKSSDKSYKILHAFKYSLKFSFYIVVPGGYFLLFEGNFCSNTSDFSIVLRVSPSSLRYTTNCFFSVFFSFV